MGEAIYTTSPAHYSNKGPILSAAPARRNIPPKIPLNAFGGASSLPLPRPPAPWWQRVH